MKDKNTQFMVTAVAGLVGCNHGTFDTEAEAQAVAAPLAAQPFALVTIFKLRYGHAVDTVEIKPEGMQANV